MAASLRANEAFDKAFDEAQAALLAGHLDEAVALFTKAIEANPKSAFAYNGRGIAYEQQKKYSPALADFTKAIQIDPKGMFFLNRGGTYSENGDAKSAIADYTRALKLFPARDRRPHIDCLVGRAHCYFDQEKREAALADLNAAIKLGVSDADPYVLRGVLHKIGHDYDKSLADYEKAIAMEPKLARSYGAAAYLLSVCPMPKYRDGARAIRYATKACELTEWRDAGEIETLAAAYAEVGDFEQAIKFQKQAATIDPKASESARLALYQRRQPVRDLNRREKAVPLPREGTVAIKIGEKLHVRFDLDGELLVNPAVKKADGKLGSNSFALNFYREKGQRILLLDHSFPRTVRVKCLARLHDWDAYFETDLLPIPPNQINPELWSAPIDELVLFDWYFSSDTDEQSVASRF